MLSIFNVNVWTNAFGEKCAVAAPGMNVSLDVSADAVLPGDKPEGTRKGQQTTLRLRHAQTPWDIIQLNSESKRKEKGNEK